MTDFRMVQGFEDAWRPPIRSHFVFTSAVLKPSGLTPPGLGVGGASASGGNRAKLARIAARAPEVMVKVTGRTSRPAHLKAHLDYISRNGQLELETSDGAFIYGRKGVGDLAKGWSAEQLADSRTRANAPFSHNIVLSMPAGTDPTALRDAARAFAADIFAGSHDYALALHTDTPRPHVHLSICSRGHMGQRLNPRKADLQQWRQTFAQALRDRGVQAEATPRRARGVTRKSERTPVRKISDRFESGHGPMAQVKKAAYREAAAAAFKGDVEPRVWERKALERQMQVRRLYLAQAALLRRSDDPLDQALGARVEAFVRGMPPPDSQRLTLARELRAAARGVDRSRSDLGPDRNR